jgi:hypothetical protein
VEIDFIDISTVGIVMLDEPLTSDIPNLDCLVLAATGYASAIRVKLNRIYSAVMITKLIDHLTTGKIP